MFATSLPCAEKKCASKMSLLEDKDGFLYYRCLEKHNEHYFRYGISQKQWERLIVARKLVFSYNQDPCKKTLSETVAETTKAPTVPTEEIQEPVNDKFELDKSALAEFEQSLVAPFEASAAEHVEAPVKECVEEPVHDSLDTPVEEHTTRSDAEEIFESVEQKIEPVSDLLNIKGIGSERVKDLMGAGVHTVSDLAQCSASDLSKETGLPISKLVTWIVKAKDLTEKNQVVIST